MPHELNGSATDDKNTILVLVDFSTKLLDTVKSQPRESLVSNAVALSKAAAAFGLPVLVLGEESERYGVFDPDIHGPVPDAQKIARVTPSAWREPAFVKAVKDIGRDHLVLAGISTDFCVGLLAADALASGQKVTIVADASGSQTEEMHRVGLERARAQGADIVTWVAFTGSLLGTWHRPEGEAVGGIFAEHIPGFGA